MAPALALPLFLGSVALTLAAAGFFADRLDRVGPRLGLPEALVGLLTALAADAPEVSSALVALAQGEKKVSLGVVLGSNAFNLAAMIGLSAALTGAVRIGRQALAVEGAVGLLVTLAAAGLLIHAMHAGVALGAFAAILVPYLVFLAKRPRAERAARSGAPPRRGEGVLRRSAALIVPAVALIVLGSVGMVRSALSLAHHWGFPKPLVGILLLAILTSLPNAYTAVRVGLGGRGAALVSETLNSNTINLVGGVLFPALVIGIGRVSGPDGFALAWLIGMTCVALALLGRRGGARRLDGAVLIGLYLAFVGVQAATR